MRYLLFTSSFLFVSCLDFLKTNEVDDDEENEDYSEGESQGDCFDGEDNDDDGDIDCYDDGCTDKPACLDSDTGGNGDTDGNGNDGDVSNPNEDPDGDGYSNLEESVEGTDPNDAESRIYTGYWPYQIDKDDYNAPTSASQTSGSLGSLLLRDQLLDQFGDQVDLYDFAGQGRYIAIDLSAIWCGPCHELAAAISSNPSDGGGWGSIPQKVHNEDIFWITILFENNQGSIPSGNDLYDWYGLYPDDKVPVLADNSSSDFANLYLGNGVPTIIVFDENMEYVSGPTSADHWAGIYFLDAL